MGIRQFSGRYLQDEDRLLFRLTTTAGAEYRLLLTRLVTSRMLAGNRHQAVQLVARRNPAAPAHAVAVFAQEALRSTTDFQQPFEKGDRQPLGHEPVLAVDVTFEVAAGDRQALTVMKLVLKDRRVITFRLPEPTLQSLTLLLEQLQRQAGWNLGAAAPDEDTATAEAAAPKAVLH